MKTIEIFAPAKLNLFLKILRKREDGYHDIETVFEKISLCDKLAVREHAHKDIIVSSNSRFIASLKEKNLAYRAAQAIKSACRIRQGVSIFLEKNTPVAAGLGGGSSDAAAVLKALNQLWRLGLSEKALMKLALEIGSDVPLFIARHPFLLGKGRGEVLKQIPVPKQLRLWHVVVMPAVKVSTAVAYGLFDKSFFSGDCSPKPSFSGRKMKLTIPDYSANIIVHALSKKDVSLLNYYSYNCFKDLITKEFPYIAIIKRKIETLSGCEAYLSGSGPSLFLTLSSRKEAQRIFAKIKRSVGRCRSFLVCTFGGGRIDDGQQGK